MQTRTEYTTIESAIESARALTQPANVCINTSPKIGQAAAVGYNSDRNSIFNVYSTFSDKLKPCFYVAYSN